MNPTNAVTVRPATADDLEALGAMAGALVRFHHEVDPRRFMLAKGVEEGYRRWFRQELDSPEAMVRVAVGGDGRVLGYTYARVEGRDWNMLLDAHVALHDVFVAPSARGARVGERCSRPSPPRSTPVAGCAWCCTPWCPTSARSGSSRSTASARRCSR
jgi:hypothetical protein